MGFPSKYKREAIASLLYIRNKLEILGWEIRCNVLLFGVK